MYNKYNNNLYAYHCHANAHRNTRHATLYSIHQYTVIVMSLTNKPTDNQLYRFFFRQYLWRW